MDDPRITFLEKKVQTLETLLVSKEAELTEWKKAAWKLHQKMGNVADMFAKIKGTSADVAELEVDSASKLGGKSRQ